NQEPVAIPMENNANSKETTVLSANKCSRAKLGN
ncbi:hypothetical protein D018_0161B, partial [Vibrio parahaemolyticus VP2007-007]